MVRAKNYENVSTFVEVMQRKLWPLFPDMVYISGTISGNTLENIIVI